MAETGKTWKSLLILLVAFQISQAVRRRYDRSKMYQKALSRSRATGKKLLVIGDPDNGFVNRFFGPDYEYGDECMDITGCPKAPPGTIVYKGRIEELLPQMDLSDRVIFISCVLEQVDDIDAVIGILNDVDRRDLFILNVNPYAIEAWWYPNFLTGEPNIKRRVFYDGKKITYRAFT